MHHLALIFGLILSSLIGLQECRPHRLLHQDADSSSAFHAQRGENLLKKYGGSHDDKFAIILSSVVSICGVSAAIASCGAIYGDRRKLSFVASLMLIVAIPMVIIQSRIIRAIGMSDAVAARG